MYGPEGFEMADAVHAEDGTVYMQTVRHAHEDACRHQLRFVNSKKCIWDRFVEMHVREADSK